MNVLKKHIIADQWSSQPWHGFLSRWSDESVCVCVSVCVPTYVPNIPKSTTSEDASTNSGWFNLEKSCPQIQPISISRNTWKPPLNSGASYQAHYSFGEGIEFDISCHFFGVISGIDDKQRRFAISQIPGLPATFCEVPGIWCPHWRHWRQRSGRKRGGNPEIPILMDKMLAGISWSLSWILLSWDFTKILFINCIYFTGFRWRSFH